MTATETIVTAERTDLLETLDKHRYFLRLTVQNLTDEQAAMCPTASELCLGGLIKHVAAAEQQWMDFVLGGPEAMGGAEYWEVEDFKNEFRMFDGETLAALLARYDEVACRTSEIVVALPDLDLSHPLPKAPWFEPGARWSARRVLLHIIAETAQHAGHADIIRETIDGSKTMG